jgi:hypothetical protein
MHHVNEKHHLLLAALVSSHPDSAVSIAMSTRFFAFHFWYVVEHAKRTQ